MSHSQDGARRDHGALTAQELHRATLDALDEGIAVLDGEGTVISVNQALERFAEADPACELRLGANVVEACAARGADDPHRARMVAALLEVLAGTSERCCGRYEVQPEGAQRPVRWFGVRATRYRGPGPGRAVVRYEDLTAVVASERAASLRGRMLDELDAAVLTGTFDGEIELWNAGAERLFGWTAQEIAGRRALDVLLEPEQLESARSEFEALQRAGVHISERPLRRKDGSSFRAFATAAVYHDEHGEPQGTIAVILDATERVRIERELREARDHLRAVTDNMGEALVTLGGSGEISYVNAAAERLLGWSAEALAGRTLHAAVHDGVCPEAQTEGLERCALLHGERERDPVRCHDDTFVRRDRSAVPVWWALTPITSPLGDTSIVVFGDITAAKATQQRLRDEIERLTQVRELHEAIEAERFVLFAQPIVDLGSGAVRSHELLLRMYTSDGAIRLPRSFLPAAEACGLIIELDRWVIGQAARLAGEGHNVEMNLSAASLGDPALFEYFQRTVDMHGAAPALLGVELTETAIMTNESVAGSFMQRAGAMGCTLALDDFGTGFGGFGYLKRLPVDYLKIDVEFVGDLITSAASRHVVEAVVGLAAAFGHSTIAEGVEDAATLALLRELGVDYAQGYLIGRPGPLRDTIYGEL